MDTKQQNGRSSEPYRVSTRRRYLLDSCSYCKVAYIAIDVTAISWAWVIIPATSWNINFFSYFYLSSISCIPLHAISFFLHWNRFVYKRISHCIYFIHWATANFCGFLNLPMVITLSNLSSILEFLLYQHHRHCTKNWPTKSSIRQTFYWNFAFIPHREKVQVNVLCIWYNCDHCQAPVHYCCSTLEGIKM